MPYVHSITRVLSSQLTSSMSLFTNLKSCPRSLTARRYRYLLTMSILPCQIRSYFPVQKYFKVIHSVTDSLRGEYSGACSSICIDHQDEKLLLTL